MNNSQNSCFLGDLVTHKKGFAFKSSKFQSDGVPVVKVTNFTESSISLSDLVYVSESHAEEKKSFKLNSGDIVIQTVGSWPSNPASVVGRVVMIPDELDQSLLNQNAVILYPKEGLDNRFLFYLLKDRSFKGYIINTAQGAANQASITLDSIFRFQFFEKPHATQRKIAAILTAYDDLIETNKRRIALLEKMAEELYREWFVRMRFPGHQDTKFVKGVPEGWVVKRIADVYQTASGGTPSRKNSEYFDGDIQWIKTGELKGVFTPDSEEKITQSAVENSAAKVFPSKTVIMAMYCAMPDISIATYDCATNQACCAFLPKFDWLHYGFNYYLLRSAQTHLVMFAHGAAQQNLSQDIISKFQILLPTEALVKDFGNVVEPLLAMIHQIADCNRVLTQTRDLLLPRLISGKLSVEDLDIQLPPSMQAEATEPESAYA